LAVKKKSKERKQVINSGLMLFGPNSAKICCTLAFAIRL
jgi:hypothetical protein